MAILRERQLRSREAGSRGFRRSPKALETLKKPEKKTERKPGAGGKPVAPRTAAAAKPQKPARPPDGDLSELDVKLLQQLAQRRRKLGQA